MKKQELIHLHGLLAEVSNDLATYHDVTFELADYESLGVRPTSIHKSKTDHKAAVSTLADELTEELEAVATETEQVTATAD